MFSGSVCRTHGLCCHGGLRETNSEEMRVVQLFFKPVKVVFCFCICSSDSKCRLSSVEAECKESLFLKPLIKVLCQKMLWKNTSVQVGLEEEYNLHEQTYY